MDVYYAPDGVEMTIRWANEEEYQLGKKFLADIDTLCGAADDPERAYAYLENERQLEALAESGRSLKEKRRT